MTVQAFSAAEFDLARVYLATTVAAMMGRKFEEEDWAKVYAAAKGFKASAWSNFDLDVMNGNLGVEHKMVGQDGAASLLACCGRSFMHPAGTRAIRFPDHLDDPTQAAREILRQYGRKIEERTALVSIIHAYHHARHTRQQALAALRESGMGLEKARSLIPDNRAPVGEPDDPPDMRFGWLIWRRDLAEFLYFETPMTIPIPKEFFGVWNERRTSGRRLSSRNLWIYREATGIKEYSITTTAGAKVQPYFSVPPPRDPNLYHFRVQGEQTSNGLVRIWLTAETAQGLKSLLGDLAPATIEGFIRTNASAAGSQCRLARAAFEPLAVEILFPADCYGLLRADRQSVSDEHAFRLLLDKSTA